MPDDLAMTDYRFEQGPIRPPSEANSLLLRVTRNCPWNQCTFCSIYKGQKFSQRPISEILNDIHAVHSAIQSIKAGKSCSENLDPWVLISAENWLRSNMESVFLQDANTLIVKPEDLIVILTAIRAKFPEVRRITSYARSQTIARISDEALKNLAAAGLNRIHIGMESGSDSILKMIKKGADKATHIAAGLKVKMAGIELSEYIMPGLGGLEHSEENALATADALNQINPDFIRIRTFGLSNGSQMAVDYNEGRFSKAGDLQAAKELLLLIENLQGITSTILSDHIINLLPEVCGVMPRDKATMIRVIQGFIVLPAEEQVVYIIGRRLGIMNGVQDLKQKERRRYALDFIEANGITAETVDYYASELMKQYI